MTVNTGKMRFDADLDGKTVITKDGRTLGQVRDVEIDLANLRVTAFVVKLERTVLDTLHLKKPFMGSQEIHVPASDVSAISDSVVLEKKLEAYAHASAPAGPEDAAENARQNVAENAPEDAPGDAAVGDGESGSS